jgi:predicted amidohydrolase
LDEAAVTRHITIAAAQYPLDNVKTLIAWRSKVTRWVEDAVGQGAEILVFPEYAAMELCSISNTGHDLEQSIAAVAALEQEIIDLHTSLAKKHGVMIVAGSNPQINGTKRCNVAHVFGPLGQHDSFTKFMPTPWERDPWKISGGRELKLYDFCGTRIGLLICYDIEFPLLSRALAEAGAEIILAPSNTETASGYWRVRTGAAARALENQIYTVQSPCVGPAPFCEAVAMNVGAAGFFAPPDKGFPENGVIALGELNASQWLIQKLDLDLIRKVRTSGGVRTFAHWKEQPGLAALPQPTLFDMGR